MEIDRESLEKTKLVCHQELDRIQAKYNTNHFELLCLYVMKEFKNQFIIAIFGLLAVCFVSYHIEYTTSFCIMIYFLLLGSMAMVEHIKNEIYDMKELMSISYMNEGRSFLYKSIIMALFQFVVFSLLCLLIPISSYSLVKIVFYALLPIYLSQIICLQFMKYISNMYTTLIVYFVIYMVIVFVVEFVGIINYFTMFSSLWVIVFVVGLYIFNTCILYKKRKGGDVIWNLN